MSKGSLFFIILIVPFLSIANEKAPEMETVLVNGMDSFEDWATNAFEECIEEPGSSRARCNTETITFCRDVTARYKRTPVSCNAYVPADFSLKSNPEKQIESQPNLNSSAASRSHGVTSISELQLKVDQCKSATRATSTCCKDPMRCVAEDAGAKDGRGYGAAGGMIQQIFTMGSMMSASGIADMCGKMKTIGNLNAVLSAGLGSYCSNGISTCEQACEGVEQSIQTRLQSCEATPGSCEVNEVIELRALANTAESQKNTCSNNFRYSSSQYQQAAASGVGAYMAGKCEDSAKQQQANNFNPEDTDAFNTNCSDPSAASNPICQNQCQRPGAENDPICRQLLGLDGTGRAGSGVVDRNPLDGTDGNENGFGLNDDLEGSQNFAGGVTAQTANKADVNIQKGPGLPGGSGASGGNGNAGSSGSAATQAKGFNTNILKGHSGGGGYSQQMGNRYQAGSSGFSGYRAQNAKRNENPFDLTRYLPGQKNKAGIKGLRNVAGLVNSSELGKPSENIFQKVSNRFHSICINDRLIDCAKGR